MLARLHDAGCARDKAGNRDLHFDHYCTLILLALFSPLARSGYEGETWMLLDCVDVLVHVFNDMARHYYDLDGLWGDAKRVQWQEAAAEAAR